MSFLQTGFLAGPAGSLHVSLFIPVAGFTPHWVVHVPAFAEEVNKCRAMVARQARALAAGGFVVVVPDLTGTGDSSGRFEDATWRGWLEDLDYVVDWGRSQGAMQLSLWGNRLGSILAIELIGVLSRPPEQLLLWQPVHSGKQYMAQFLRLRMAAGLTAGTAETTASLRQRLAEDGRLEVAGYMLSAALFNDVESRDITQFGPPVATRVGVLEVSAQAGKPLLPVTARLLERWVEAGIDCQGQTVQGDPFWMTQELGFAPGLIEQTVAQLSAGSGNDSRGGDQVALPCGQPYSLPPNLGAESGEGARAVVFNCGQYQLAGIVHRAAGKSTLGVLVLVGGPQYRVGSHRQFVLLAQYLAAAGIPTLRFDYRGMGDSAGELPGFEHVDPDVRCAIDAFQAVNPEIEDIVIWGLCDAASAAVFYAAKDPRVKGLILANPWVYSTQGSAKAYLKHYYVRRFFQRDFWGKVVSGNYKLTESFKSGWALVDRALGGRAHAELSCPESPGTSTDLGHSGAQPT